MHQGWILGILPGSFYHCPLHVGLLAVSQGRVYHDTTILLFLPFPGTETGQKRQSHETHHGPQQARLKVSGDIPYSLLCSFTRNVLCYQHSLWDLKHLPWNRGDICRTEQALFSCFRKSEKLTVQRKLFIQHDAISFFSWSILSFHLILFLFFSRHFCKSVSRNGQYQSGYLQDCVQRNSNIPKPCAREKIHHHP